MAQKEDIAYLSNIKGMATVPSGAVSGNIALFGEKGALLDSGKKPSDFVSQEDVASSVDSATESIWNAVNGVYAIAAFNSSAWSAGTAYPVGGYCKHGGSGYRCKAAHTSGQSFDPSKWDLVLTAEGANVILAMLSAYSNEGLASLLNLAPAYSGSKNYTVGMLAKKDGVLQICTAAGRGPVAVFSTNASVELSIATRIAKLAESLPTKTSQLTNDSGFLTEKDLPKKLSNFENDPGYLPGSSLLKPYDTSEGGYEAGEKCSKDGKLYICTSAVSKGAEWNAEDWREADLDEIVAAASIQAHPDWNEDDPNDPAYIKNKPNIRYKVENILYSATSDEAEILFNLKDRTVNVVTASISDNNSIRLGLPPSVGFGNARDFYVVLNVSSDKDVSVTMASASLKDYAGGDVTLVARAGQVATYRFVESATEGRVFTVYGISDPAYTKVMEIERALDEILADGGVVPFVPGVFIPNMGDGKFYRILAVTDDETGEVNIGVDQEGVEK
jgi:hypothetical protein